ncbi:MAG: hypothetical protein EOP49_35910 [Sphingobacteriales bacterium]|nr:MAG: hypothetical protein EOP49_35910 [Sphingobacteriales bacterium]
MDDALEVRGKSFITKGRKNLLFYAYLVRVGATTTLMVGNAGLALSQSGSYFRWLAMSRQNSSLTAVYRFLAGMSKNLASSQTALLLFSRLMWASGIIVIVVTVAILILDDDALEKWCLKCCYGRDDKKRFDNDADEISEFFDAIQGVL